MLWLRKETDSDMLRLLVLIARGLGARYLDDYQPPAERWEDHEEDERLEAMPGADRRRAEVLAFIAGAGGEVS